MKILGNLGHIKRAIYTRAGQNDYEYDPNKIHQILIETNTMIDAIQPKIVSQICDATRQSTERNPGEISSGVKKAKGFFSKALERLKNIRE